jgi:hypothetical protein
MPDAVPDQAAQATPKRPPGRPAKSAGAGAYKPVLVTLYAEHLATAKRIDSNTSAAVRMALDHWASQHPEALRETT